MKNHIFTFLVCIALMLSIQSILANNELIPNKVSTATSYSWENPNAIVLANGDLQWAPLPFQLVVGSSVRYIDFVGGNDNNNGQTTTTAWKHHPWDAAATGLAAAGSGIQTYIFKRGVIYRGILTSDESGTEGNPIRLTSDPAWGTGEASIYGSVQQTSGWTKSNASISPNIPNPTSVWYKTVSGLNRPKMVCEVTPTGIKRVRLARTPNYEDTPNEPMQKWWTVTSKISSTSFNDTENLGGFPANYFSGGDVWATEGDNAITMCTLWKQNINSYNPSTSTISFPDPNFAGKNGRYYTENTPYMLDVPGEYYYDGSRVFIRLEGDKDPNTTTIEIGKESTLLTLSSKNNVEISGITFGFTTNDVVRFGDEGIAAIRLASCNNMVIKNCKFLYLNGGVQTTGPGVGNNIVFTDNEMNFMDDFAAFLFGVADVTIQRNKVYETGTRHQGRWYSAIMSIAGNPAVGDISGNMIDHAWGSALNFTWGKNETSSANIPFIRGLVHHNRVTHALQGVNDYGAIEAWQGGPVYTYNNISEDAQGLKYNTDGTTWSLGFPFYFDGAFKQYVFNNIVKGTGWSRNGSAYNTVLGYYNMYVHNVSYNTSGLTGSGSGDLAMDGRNYFLGNVADSCQIVFTHEAVAAGVPFESYANNFSSGRAFRGKFGPTGTASWYYLDGFIAGLNSFKAQVSQTGFETSARVFENPAKNDYRPTATSEAIDKGVKFFVPFALSNVVGEWGFQKHNADSSVIKAENFFFTPEFSARKTYKNVYKNNLKAFNLTTSSFVAGNLEDYADGALNFNGTSTYCRVSNSYNSSVNLNLISTSFVIETYFKTTPGHTGGTLLSKFLATGYGYQMGVNSEGKVKFDILNNNSAIFSLAGSKTVNDGGWHHVLLEVDKTALTSKIYIDGVLANGESIGSLPTASITNNSEFAVGKNKDGNFFAGTIDFLRISKGSLADAKTTFDELYKWQFDGPFLRDFTGALPIGKRDAGAIERGAKLCVTTASTNQLDFGLEGGTKTFTVNAAEGFSIVKLLDVTLPTNKKIDAFYSYSVDGNTVTVTAPVSTKKRIVEIWILGCNETQKVNIVQQLSTGIKSIKSFDIDVAPNPVSMNDPLTITLPQDFKSSKAVVVDLNGGIIDEIALQPGTNTYSISYPKGMYILNVIQKNFNYKAKIIVK